MYMHTESNSINLPSPPSILLLVPFIFFCHIFIIFGSMYFVLSLCLLFFIFPLPPFDSIPVSLTPCFPWVCFTDESPSYNITQWFKKCHKHWSETAKLLGAEKVISANDMMKCTLPSQHIHSFTPWISFLNVYRLNWCVNHINVSIRVLTWLQLLHCIPIVCLEIVRGWCLVLFFEMKGRTKCEENCGSLALINHCFNAWVGWHIYVVTVTSWC